MIGNKVGKHGKILDRNRVINENMVASNSAVKFKAGERGFDTVLMGEVAEKIERAHRGRVMDDIQVAAHDERPLDLVHELPDFFESPNRIFITDGIGAPKTVVIDHCEAVFKAGDLEVEIVRWHTTECDMFAIFTINKFGRGLSERDAAEDEIPQSTIAPGEVKTPVR